MNELSPPPEPGLLRKLSRLPRPIIGLILVPILGVIGVVVAVASYVLGALLFDR
jgi:hypothetical protein